MEYSRKYVVTIGTIYHIATVGYNGFVIDKKCVEKLASDNNILDFSDCTEDIFQWLITDIKDEIDKCWCGVIVNGIPHQFHKRIIAIIRENSKNITEEHLRSMGSDNYDGLLLNFSRQWDYQIVLKLREHMEWEELGPLLMLSPDWQYYMCPPRAYEINTKYGQDYVSDKYLPYCERVGKMTMELTIAIPPTYPETSKNQYGYFRCLECYGKRTTTRIGRITIKESSVILSKTKEFILPMYLTVRDIINYNDLFGAGCVGYNMRLPMVYDGLIYAVINTIAVSIIMEPQVICILHQKVVPDIVNVIKKYLIL